MTQFFHNLSVKQKFNTIILGVCSTILLLTFTIAFISQWFLYQRNALEELQSLSKIIGDNSTAALLFQDDEALENNLHSLAQKTSILTSAIYRADGARVASFSRGGHQQISPQRVKNTELEEKGYMIHDGRIQILTPIILDNERVGTLYLQASMGDLYKLLLEAAGYLVLLLLGGLVLAVVLANRLQKIITGPVTQLTTAIQQISTEKNYRLRVKHKSKDEFGLLAEGFNNMLGQIQQRDEHLEEQVRNRTAELQLTMDKAIVLADEAQAASKAKSQFLANMSHEIRTPMNGVLGMAEMALDMNLTLEQQNAIETIKSSGESLLTIINDILDFSKIEAGKLEIETINFNLPALIEEIAQILAHRAHAKGLELIVDIAETLHPDMSSDPSRIRQVLTNLLSNAIKFTEQGEVYLKVESLKDMGDSEQVRFLVRDTGIGMTAEERKKLFQPFSQADESTTRKYGGTGLGLAISRQLVELMDGQINCTGNPGEGAEFWFDLTLKKTAGTRILAQTPTQELKGLSALVVDDNQTNRELLTHQMNSWGIKQEGAEDGLKGLTILHRAVEEKRPFDMVLLDMHMPHMDGLDVARLIRKDPTLERTKIIILTSVGIRGDAQLAREAGINIYLTKPVRQVDLYNSLVELMNGNYLEKKDLITQYHLKKELTTFNARVLLAEDNIINQQVAKGVLCKLGCRVELATNGLEAVSAAQKESYDIVFMDCQMPRMDGYEATGKIRWMEDLKSGQKRLPIIALTANALSGDREKCLAAGMDDYISKPFGKEKIIKVLKHWLPENLHSPSQANLSKKHPHGVSDQSPPMESKTIDTKVLNSIRDLQADGAEDLLTKIIKLFLEDTPGQLEKIKLALENSDIATLRLISHSLKSGSANLGALNLSALFRKMEENARNDSMEGASELFVQIEREFQKAVKSLSAEMVTDIETIDFRNG
ncbi:BarA [Desulforapulum autotrophicum HRM2]|uniref:Sensory/regulatory protein RpfC n=1 Tax=Desulforapulum autotrophicum (strain ATCC 43914 / DSM 3382 / VKM B-1955 / HRM2) TaxID=177437 RepID=C0QF75_DESAH|nr:response regulator [Desulforapulum autotrophicum]ACN17576.1 BarA [Desulforapulum autotrophicum HRM2]